MVKVKHVRLRSQVICTSQGKFSLDAHGVFEANEDQASVLCDDRKYAGTFQRVVSEPEAEPVKVAPVAPVAPKAKPTAPKAKVEVKAEAPKAKKAAKQEAETLKEAMAEAARQIKRKRRVRTTKA